MKDFDNWNINKKILDKKVENILPKKKEIWWIFVGLNIGVEEDGKNENFERPVLVIKVFNRQCFLGIPTTSTDKTGKKYYFPIKYKQNKYFLVLSQIRLFSTKRLSRKIFNIGSKDFLNIKKELGKIINI